MHHVKVYYLKLLIYDGEGENKHHYHTTLE